jgi:hypothetical protein
MPARTKTQTHNPNLMTTDKTIKSKAFLLLCALLAMPSTAMALVIRHNTPTLNYENHGKLAKFNASVAVTRSDNKEHGIAGGTAIDSRWLVHARHTYRSVSDYMATGKTAVARGTLWSKWNNTGTSNRQVHSVHFFDDDFSRFANAIDIAMVRLNGSSSALRIAPLFSGWGEVGNVGMGASSANNRLDGNGTSRKPENEATSASGRPYEVRWVGSNNVDKVETQSLGSPNNALLKMDFDHPTNASKSIMGTATALDLEYGSMNGDSGSPVYIDNNGVDGQVAGVLSGGSGNDYGSSLVYVRIAPYRTWINQTIINNPDTRSLNIASISNRNVGVGVTMSVTANATGSDLPPLSVVYSLVSPPPGATVNATSGVITWTPSQSDAGTSKVITVKATDNGIPVKSVTRSFTVTVPDMADDDNDGMGDAWEMTHFETLDRDGTGDFDQDGLSDLDEFIYGTNPKMKDSDGDTHEDGWEVARGFDPTVPTPIYQWTAGGDGQSIFQEANWTRAGGTAVIPVINPATALTVDLLVDAGSAGGGGFSNVLDLGTKRLGIHGGMVQSQTAHGIRGSNGSKVTLAAGTLSVGYLDGVPVEIFKAPSLRFRQAVNPLRNEAKLKIMAGASPRITLLDNTISGVISSVLPHIEIDGDTAVDGANVVVRSNSAGEVIIYRAGDTDGDGASDEWEWNNNYNPVSGHDGLDDDDDDGTPNWLESRLGTDPRVRTPGIFLRIIEAGTGSDHSGGGLGGEDDDDLPPEDIFGDVILHAGPGGSDLSYNIFTADNPSGPWSLLESIDGNEIPHGDTVEVYHSEAPPQGAFYRLEVSRDDP